LQNSGTIIYDKTNYNWRFNNGGTFTNLAAGTVDLQSDRSLDSGAYNGVFNNYGLVTKTAGTSTNLANVAFNSYGGSSFNVPSGRSVYLSASGSFTGTATGQGVGPTINAGIWTAGSEATLAGDWRWTGGTFNSGTLTNTGTLTITGASDYSTIDTAAAVLQNSGTIIYDKTNYNWRFNNGGTFTNLAAGTVDLQGDRSLDSGAYNGFVHNYGLIKKTTGTSTVFANQTLTNYGGGTIDVQVGDISVPLLASGANGGTIQVAAGTSFTRSGGLANNGTIRGAGTINVGAGNTLTNAGILSPGLATGDATGTLSITGNLSMATGGQLYADLYGTAAGDYDVLAVSGTATLTDGTLSLTGSGGIGSYPVVAAATVTGTFATVNSGFFVVSQANGGTVLNLNVSANNIGSTIFWDGGAADGLWTSANNWSGDQAPDVSDNLYIGPTAGTVTIATGDQAANTLTTDAPFSLSGGSLTLAATSAFNGGLSLSGGSLRGGGNVSIGTSFTWSGGSVAGSGTLTTPSGVTTALQGGVLEGTRIWNNVGAINFAPAGADFTINAAATLNNSGSLTVAPTVAGSDILGGGTLNNSGSLSKTTATAVSIAPTLNQTAGSIDIAAGILNVGTLNLSGGTLGGVGSLAVTTDFNQSGGTLGSSFDTLALSRTGNFSIGGVAAVNGLYVMSTGGNVTLSGGALTTSAANSQITVAAPAGNVVNAHGAGALQAGAGGRWLVYVAAPSNVTKNGLTSAFRQYNTSYGATVNTSTGNGFVYTAAPGSMQVNTALASGSLGHTYGDTPAAASFTYTLTPLTADSEETVASIGLTGTAAFSGAPTSTTAAGARSVGYASGLSSSLGFGLSAGSALAYAVAQRPLTVTADAKSMTYGDALPALTYVLTSGSLVGSDTFGGGLTTSGSSSARERQQGV
ncbi:MAG: MBG-2 domain-containing protein, partial [Rhodocyclales bacterium]|nr:MBG-2 domain-containing protein [Rhodocyclales bacterium]